jgi:predicted DNA-binding protein (MmcQ/YjbR family)
MACIGRHGWNSVRIEGALGEVPDDDELRELVDASHDAIVATLPRRLRPLESRPPESRTPARP